MSEHDKYKVNAVQHVKKRVAMHAQKSLVVADRPGFRRYVMNDTPGRREKFELAGYTAVQNKADNQCDANITKGAHIGSDLKLTVNQGVNAPCQTATVMEIPEEWYNEDFLAAQGLIDKNEEALNPEKYSVRGSIGGSFKRESEKVNNG